MAADFELHEGEQVIEELNGDYWERILLIFYTKKVGKYWLTSDRIVFKGIIVNLDLPYKEIESVKTCCVGGAFIKLLPTGLSVKMKDGKSYRLSVMGRKKIMELIQSKIG